MPRFIVVAPEWKCQHSEEFGWRCVDSVNGWTVASGSQAMARRYARSLNARTDLAVA